MAAPSGTTWGSIAGSYGRIGIYVSLSNTNTQTTRHTEIWFWSKYSVDDSSNTLYYDDNATSATTSKGSVTINTTVDTGEGWSTSNQVKLKEYDYTFDRGTSSSTRSVAAKLTDVDRVGATMTVTTTYTIPALPSYTVSYNANGGSGAPSSQIKYYGKTLTLSSTKPTRTGYTFAGWGTSTTDTTVDYSAGGSYTANASDTLYAIWTEHKLTINYYSNYATAYGGTSTALNTVSSDKNVLVYSQNFLYDNDYSTYGLSNYSNSTGSVYMTRTGYTGTGNWGTSTNGGTLINENTGYATGQALAKALGKDLSSGNASISLYAQWSENTLTVNYYSNYADYGTYKGEALNVSASTNVLVHTQNFLYNNSYSSALSNVQNTSYLYLSRTGYTPTGFWGTTTTGGTLIDEDADYSTGQALAQALGKSLANGNASVNVYPQWNINTYTIGYDGNGGYGSMNIQSVDWQETFTLLDNQFKREGYKFVGWNVQREIDRKWYALGSPENGWLTENEILAGEYEKKLYANQDELLFDMSWIKGETGVIHEYTMYAVWEISGVVYIDNGTTLEPYLVYIDNGSSWDLYLTYVDDGTSWTIIS